MNPHELFDKLTGRKNEYFNGKYITSLPDLDFDYPSSYKIEAGTRLTLANGKPHPVGHSMLELPWSLTKDSVDRLGLMHVDLLPSSVLDDLDTTKPFKDLDAMMPCSITHSADKYYHIGKWQHELIKFNPQTIVDLAEFIGLIRPKVRQLFLNTGNSISFESSKLQSIIPKSRIVFQDDFINLFSEAYGIDFNAAEYARSPGNFSNLKPTVSEADIKLLMRLYTMLNKHTMNKGHCLAVAYNTSYQFHSKS